MDVQEIVRKAVEMNASDIFVVAGSSIAYKVKNKVIRLEDEILMP